MNDSLASGIEISSDGLCEMGARLFGCAFWHVAGFFDTFSSSACDLGRVE